MQEGARERSSERGCERVVVWERVRERGCVGEGDRESSERGVREGESV